MSHLTITTPRVLAISRSARKGERKQNIPTARLIAHHGMEGDAHAGPWHRQISLLGMESIAAMQAQGAVVAPGDFAENITVEGLAVYRLPVGTVLRLGKEIRLRITQIGKECHQGCAIREQVGDCIMPRQGVFAEVLAGGILHVGDAVQIEENGGTHERASGTR